MNLKEAQREARMIHADARSISRLADSDPFERAWELASPDEQVHLMSLIRKVDKLGVETYVKALLRRAHDGLSLRELRALARARGMPYYCNMTKDELLKELGNA